MSDEWTQAARNLSDKEKNRALRALLENANEPQAGVIRQILGEENKPLTEKQLYVYEKYIEPALVERCGAPSCQNFCVAGESFCPTCSVEYGE